MILRGFLAAGVLMLGITILPALAAPSCTPWADQGDGTSYSVCVNDDGTTHCYKINNKPGSTAYEVTCS